MRNFAGPILKRAAILKSLAVALVGLVFIGSSSRSYAADYTIAATISKAFTPITFVEVPVPNYLSQVGTPLIYQVDFYINASGFNSGLDQRGFGNITFDIARTAGLGNTSSPGWQPNNAIVDVNGAPPPGPSQLLWDTNADFGPADLQNIVVSIAVIPTPNPADPRPHVGEPPSFAANNFMGSVFIDWNGLGIQTLTAAPKNPSFAHTNGAISLDPLDGGAFKTSGQFERDLVGTLHSATIIFGIPEPSTIVLVGLVLPALGLIALCSRRKIAANV